MITPVPLKMFNLRPVCTFTLVCALHSQETGAQPAPGGYKMLHWSLMFLVFAIIAAILGFGGLAGTAVGIAKILFFVFLIVWLVALISGRRAV